MFITLLSNRKISRLSISLITILVTLTLSNSIYAGPAEDGKWGSVIQWPHIPVSAANLPDGRILTWASNERNRFPGNPPLESTYTSVWDPATNQFQEIFRNGHDMFCAHLSMLEDGRVLVNGGNSSGRVTTSLFDYKTDQWTKVEDMNRRRWYNTTLAMPDGDVFTMIGTNGGAYPEVWREGEGWTLKNGINFSAPILNYSSHYEQRWWPLIHLAPNGKIFHSGPTPKMHWIDLDQEGSLVEAAPTNNGWYPKHGTTVMYDEGKLITAGGAIAGNNQASTNKTMLIDLNGTAPQVRQIAPMNFARKFLNGVMLPNGELLAVGGNTSGRKFNDSGTVYPVETWNPTTETWRSGASSSKPRNYHSIALLLTDGRVLSAGGGLCGCSADHMDGQIYSPGYLFNTDGSLATRPIINTVPAEIDSGTQFNVTATANIQKFNLIKLSSTTHAMNTDLRFLNVAFNETSNGQYQLSAHSNINVLTPGYWMLFAINSQGTPSVAKVIQVKKPQGITPESNLAYEYFEGSWNTLPNFDNLTSTSTGKVSRFTLGPRLRSDNFAIRYTGNIRIDTAGSYTFSTTSDDGSQLFIDGSLIVNNDGLHASQKRSASTTLSTGIHEIVVTFFEKTGGEQLIVSYSGPGFSEKEIPSDVLVTNTNFTLVQPVTTQATINGSTASYTLNLSGANGEVTYRWNFGDGSAPVTVTGLATIDHVFANPGRYIVSVTATDTNGNVISTEFYQSIHTPISVGTTAASSSILFDSGSDRLWNVNPDNNSVSVFNSAMSNKIAEITINGEPHSLAKALDDNIWVAHSKPAGISIIDAQDFSVSTIQLTENSQPYGIIFDDLNNRAFVTLQASGQLVEIDGFSQIIKSTTDIGYMPRHLSYSSDHNAVLVSRFITPPLPFESTSSPETAFVGAEVVVVDSETMIKTDTIILQHSDRSDSEHSGRGVPNYLGAAVISPDGLSAWVPSKQDNILRGSARDGQELTHDLTVRAVASKIDLGNQTETFSSRVDLDNASVANSSIYDKYGNYLFVTLEGNQQVAVIDAYSDAEVFRFDVGRAPQGLALSDDNLTLYTHNFMDRTISAHDISSLIENGELNVSQITALSSVSSENLATNIFKGKQLFYDAKDIRLASQEYMSCASCHNDGGDDGRVWDFTQFGEGLRNSINLQGHGEGQGRLHWSANFDEVHDFEGQIRDFAGGSGLMDDADFNAGTRSDPLGDPKAGISTDLDNLAAYVTSLTKFGQSPERQGNVISANAQAGKVIFNDNNCASCHSGEKFTDSETGALHDIGTINGDTGLTNGVDTPTLAGLWSSAPYLHDGSAITVKDAVIAHNNISLDNQELDQLVAYLRTIDDTDKNIPPVPDNTAPTVSITSPASGTSVDVAQSVTLTGNASDQEDGSLSSSLNWTSSLDGSLGSGANVTATLSVGTHTITATVTDSGGLSASTNINITVTDNTGGGGTVNDIVVDNTDTNTSKVGSWPLSSGTPTHDGSNSFYRVGVGSFRWIPTVVTAGQYQVYAWWTYHYNRDPAAAYAITHSAGSDSVVKSQNDQSLGGQWVLLGTYNFNAGTGGYVELTSSDNGRSSSVDAIKLVYVGGGTPPPANTAPTVSITAPLTGSSITLGQSLTFTATASDQEDGSLDSSVRWQSSLDGLLATGANFTNSSLSAGTHTITASVTDSGGLSASANINITVTDNTGGGGTVNDIVVDNTDTNTSKVGSWPLSSGTPTHDGSNSFYRVGVGSFRWIPTVVTAGQYQVYAWWTYHYNRDPAASYAITHSAGSDAVIKSQNDLSLGGQWILLGAYNFNAGTGGYVELTSGDNGRSSSVDAIKLVYVGGGTPPPANTAPSVSITAPTSGTSIDVVQSVTLTGNASDQEDGSLSGSLNWNSSLDGSLGSGANVTTTLSVGTHTITAKVTDSGGLSANRSILIIVNNTQPPANTAPTISIISPASGTSIDVAQSVTLTGNATDQEDGSLSSSLNWTSSLDGSLGSGANVTATLSVGIHTITATVTDSGGLSASANINITVTDSGGGTVNDIVVDNTDTNTSKVGTWPLSSGTPTHDGSNSFYRVGVGSFRWIPTVVTAGQYQVYAWWTYHYNRDPAAAYAINHGAGSDTVIKSQNDLSLGGQWILLGAYNFNAGTGGYVELTSGDNGRSSSVDAIKLVYVGGGTPPPANTAPSVSITSPTSGTSVDVAQSVTFTGNASDQEDGSLSGSLNWTSSLDGTLGSGANVTTTLSIGTHTITATVTDSGGLSANRSISIIVNNTQPPPSGSCSGLEREAEEGDLFGSMASGIDPLASGGNFIHVPNGTGNHSQGLGNNYVELCFTVDQAGKYRLTGTIKADSTYDNSFFVTIDGLPGNGYLWDTSVGTSYQTDLLSHRNGADPVEVNLNQGIHKIRFYHREDGTQLDKARLILVP